ncbi:CbtB domain-containing protein [Alsobacter sp. SYSU BS001988]|jgi:cobalt transporter subunit CbtB
MLQNASQHVAAPVRIEAGVAIQALFAILLGVFVVGFAGFSQIDAVHNAAHDTRHANAFPCH